MGCNVKEEWVSGNIFIRSIGWLDTGETIQGHKHNFDHTMIVFKGAVKVNAVLPTGEKVERTFMSPRPDYGGPSHCLIKAGVTHELVAVEPDTTAWCVFSHREPQGEVVLKYDGWQGAYQ